MYQFTLHEGCWGILSGEGGSGMSPRIPGIRCISRHGVRSSLQRHIQRDPIDPEIRKKKNKKIHCPSSATPAHPRRRRLLYPASTSHLRPNTHCIFQQMFPKHPQLLLLPLSFLPRLNL